MFGKFSFFSYRLHHIQAHYRLNLLTHMHQLAAHNILSNHAQLHLIVESISLWRAWH